MKDDTERADTSEGLLSRWSQRKAQHRSTTVTKTRESEPPAANHTTASQTPRAATAGADRHKHTSTLTQNDSESPAIPTDSSQPNTSQPNTSQPEQSQPELSQPELSQAKSTQADTSLAESDAEEPLLTDADMPSLDDITSSSDMSCFFNAGVSETLRQAALKKLLRLPAFNIRDGLNDYDEDYTVFEPLGDTVTSDMKFHAERKRLQQEAEEARLQEEAQAEQDKTEPDEPQSDEPAPAEPQQPAHEGVDDQQVADSDEPVHTTEQEHTDEPVPTDEPVQTDEVTPGKDAVLEPGYHSKSRSQGSSETQHRSNTLQDFPARQGDSRHGKLARTGPVKHTVAHAEKHQLNNDASRGAADNTDSEPAIDAGTHKELLS